MRTSTRRSCQRPRQWQQPRKQPKNRIKGDEKFNGSFGLARCIDKAPLSAADALFPPNVRFFLKYFFRELNSRRQHFFCKKTINPDFLKECYKIKFYVSRHPLQKI